MGLQSGSVVGGVIGVKHPRYRLFGDIVNTAARMETRSDPGRLHVAENAANILRETGMFKLTDRGELVVKGKGVMHTYFVDGLAADAVEPGALRSALARISNLNAEEEAHSSGSPGSTLSPLRSIRPQTHWKKTVSNLKSANAIAMLGVQTAAKRDDLQRGIQRLASMNFDQWMGVVEEESDDESMGSATASEAGTPTARSARNSYSQGDSHSGAGLGAGRGGYGGGSGGGGVSGSGGLGSGSGGGGSGDGGSGGGGGGGGESEGATAPGQLSPERSSSTFPARSPR